jgi:hypothetical protein
MNESREAYDLHNPACRANARARLKRGGWKRIWFLKLIITDTKNNVCPPRNAERSGGPIGAGSDSRMVGTEGGQG